MLISVYALQVEQVGGALLGHLGQ